MKRGLFIVLLLVVAVFAAENLQSDYQPGIPRYNDFPLDNIHILRLQDASKSLGGNVSMLKEDLAVYEESQTQELRAMRESISRLHSEMAAQMQGLQVAIDGMDENADVPYVPVVVQPAEVQQPVEIKTPPYLFLLLGVNLFLLILIIVLIFWLREHYFKFKEHKEEHKHVAPSELVDYIHRMHVKGHKDLHQVRLELAKKGWTPSIIEHAIHAAKEKEESK